MEGSFSLYQETTTDKRKSYTSFNGKKPGRHAPQPRQYQIQHLWEQHHRMLRLALLGLNYKDIAAELGVTPQTVSNTINSAMGQKLLQEMRGAANKEAVDTASRLKEMNDQALDVLEEILKDADKPIALRAKVAMDNLSRTGFAPQINVKGTFDHRHFGPDDIERIKLFAVEAAKRQGCLVLEDQQALKPQVSCSEESEIQIDICQETTRFHPSMAQEIEIDTIEADFVMEAKEETNSGNRINTVDRERSDGN
jgi:predicted transcriptional regulator